MMDYYISQKHNIWMILKFKIRCDGTVYQDYFGVTLLRKVHSVFEWKYKGCNKDDIYEKSE